MTFRRGYKYVNLNKVVQLIEDLEENQFIGVVEIIRYA